MGHACMSVWAFRGLGRQAGGARESGLARWQHCTAAAAPVPASYANSSSCLQHRLEQGAVAAVELPLVPATASEQGPCEQGPCEQQPLLSTNKHVFGFTRMRSHACGHPPPQGGVEPASAAATENSTTPPQASRLRAPHAQLVQHHSRRQQLGRWWAGRGRAAATAAGVEQQLQAGQLPDHLQGEPECRLASSMWQLREQRRLDGSTPTNGPPFPLLPTQRLTQRKWLRTQAGLA